MKSANRDSVRKLEVFYIVPSRYDDDGYVFQWYKGVVPSNSLSVMKALFNEWVIKEGIEGVKVTLQCYDESVQRIPVDRIAKRNRTRGTKVLVGLVGVQSGQFARASDLAKQFRARGVDVLIGGFHVSGSLSLFDETPPELDELIRLGVTLIQGEGETKELFRRTYLDAIRSELQPIYRFPKGPDLDDVPGPKLERDYIRRFAVPWGTIDSSRGCPFGCSFCTVINVQGRKMRSRTAESVLKTIRDNFRQGITHYFFTDDNFSRSKIWREVFDGLIELRQHGKPITFMMQVDTQSWKIPDFVEMSGKAGCRMVFVGMESVNPKNLESVGKTQNHVEEYREMTAAWKKAGTLVHVGYIIGLPNDTPESIRTDIAFLRDHVGVHEASFFMLTPLPGSVDHKNMVLAGTWLDPDLNKYDSFHETFRHANMAPGEWQEAAIDAFARFYDTEGMVRILRRTTRKNYWYMFRNLIWYRYAGVYSKTHPMSTGLLRIKRRNLRRPGCSVEGPFTFLWRRLKEGGRELAIYTKLFFEFREIWLLSRPGHEERKNLQMPGSQVLRDIRHRLESLGDTIALQNWSGHYEESVNELRLVLVSTAKTLRNLGETIFASRRRHARKLFDVAKEIDEKIVELKANPASPSIIARTEQFIFQQLLQKYEILSSRYVKWYDIATNGRNRAIQALKEGNFFNLSLLISPWSVTLDVYLALRFSWAMLCEEH